MRAVILAVLTLSLFPIDKVLGDCACADPDPSMTRQPQPIGQNRDSSFRGIRLSSPPEHVCWYAQAARRLGIVDAPAGADGEPAPADMIEIVARGTNKEA